MMAALIVWNEFLKRIPNDDQFEPDTIEKRGNAVKHLRRVGHYPAKRFLIESIESPIHFFSNFRRKLLADRPIHAP